MANHSYMTITGKRQGLISAGCSSHSSIGNKCQPGHQDEIMVLAYSHDMVTGNDGSIAGGRGKHMPIMITKGIDKSSPLLASALHEREEVECRINFYRTASSGGASDITQYISPVHVLLISASKSLMPFA